MDISVEEFRENMRQMKDFSFTASNGVKVTMNLSLLRSMTPEEREARARHRDRVLQEMYDKYILRPALEAQKAAQA